MVHSSLIKNYLKNENLSNNEIHYFSLRFQANQKEYSIISYFQVNRLLVYCFLLLFHSLCWIYRKKMRKARLVYEVKIKKQAFDRMKHFLWKK